MKKLLSLLGSIGLVASTGVTTVVSCNPDKNNKDDSLVKELKAGIDLFVIKGINGQDITFKSIDEAVSAANSLVAGGNVVIMEAGKEPTAAEGKILFVKAEKNDDKSIKVSYKESKADEKDATKFVWGDVQSYTENVTIKSDDNQKIDIKLSQYSIESKTQLLDYEIHIENASELKNITVEITEKTEKFNINIKYSDGTIKVSASTGGTATITIKADNATADAKLTVALI